VKYEHRETGLIVRVEDNGIGRKRSKELKTKNQLQNESTGMYNIENRVKIINDMFKTQIELKIEDVSLEQGTLVTLWIPNKNLYTEA
jgi:sensor histidine kinase YesM